MTTTPIPPQHPAAPSHPAPPGRRNVAGVVSLILGIVLLVWRLAFSLIQAWAVGSGDTSVLIALGAISAVAEGIVALGAVAFGITGILSRSPSKVPAGIGTGIGALALTAVAGGLLFSALAAAFSG